MLSDKAKKMFNKLNLEHPAVAIKYCVVKPKDIEQQKQNASFCEYIKIAQTTGKTFYISKENDQCFGKMVLGMIEKPAVGASGQAGYDFGVYKTPIACQKLYQQLPTLVPGAVNYVIFSPVATCEFDPDLIIAIADIPKADIIMRATSFISGDLWQSLSSPVISCAWLYAYPIISGKVNFITTGMYHGLKRRKTYPAGLKIISIPFNKIDEVVTALDQMDWTTIAFREDSESVEELKRRMDNWGKMSEELNCEFHLK